MPTAVMTESSEKTISITAIWISTLMNEVAFSVLLFSVLACRFELLVHFHDALADQKQAADEQDQLRKKLRELQGHAETEPRGV